ncbi:MAG: LD-carboxypeptidase [Cyanobacteriota bacterium]|nr:LD-carboxypeptidase [Cyanobacteriota bacterium]
MMELKPGDLVRVIAPSGCLREMDNFHKGVEIWRSRGYDLELAPGYDEQWGYLAGTDEGRRRQLEDALKDPRIRGIVCARGGYGTTRLLENWKDNFQFPTPKCLIGFSDITALLWRFSQLGVFCVHGPVLTTLAAEPQWSQERLFDLLEGLPVDALQGVGWGGAKVRGTLLPANLTVAGCLLGTKYQPNLEGAILAFEDVGEAPYRLDRMLTQWRMMGALEGVKGIALGRFSRCVSSRPNYPSFTVEEVMSDRFGDLGLPVVSGLPFGHDGVNAALPVGVEAVLDGEAGSLAINN